MSVLFLICGVLGVVLLSKITLETNFVRVTDVDNALAGMVQFNRSIITPENASLDLPASFMFNLNLLYDPKSARSVPPVSTECVVAGPRLLFVLSSGCTSENTH
jgi:hypothetical protein